MKKVVLDAVYQAQGKGCAPGILGVCVGGDRANGLAEAKRQLFRPLDDGNPEPVLAALRTSSSRRGTASGSGRWGSAG